MSIRNRIGTEQIGYRSVRGAVGPTIGAENRIGATVRLHRGRIGVLIVNCGGTGWNRGGIG